MISKSVAVAIAGFCLIAPALADDAAAPDNDNGRYSFNKIDQGFLRLDTMTGEVSLCSQHTVGWACQAIPEDRTLFENEIARLRRENGALKQDLLAHGLSLPAGVAPDPTAAHTGEHAPRFADRVDLDRMMAFVDQMWHRLVDAIAQAQKQVRNKS